MAEELVTQLINVLKDWAKKQNTKHFNKFYLFGSLIYKGGNQFLRDISDIDLVVILQDSIKGSLNRAKVCQEIQKAKFDLELLLRPILQRKNKSKPIVSLVLVTGDEVHWDIHKLKSPRFFRDNDFFNLLEESNTLYSVGIDNRENLSHIIQALEKAQYYRNKYLDINPNKSLKEYNEQDIFPKDLARSAALVHAFDKKNEKEKCDINLGNSYLISLLHQKAGKKDNEWSKLNSKVGERANRSIKRPGLNDFDLLLIHELLFDKAYKLLKQDPSINPSKGGHHARAKGNPPAPPAAKVQSKKILETKTKSESSTVAREYGKTTSVDPAKLATAKKKSTSRKTPASKTRKNRSYEKVKDPKNWVMLNNKFFLIKSFETQQDQSLVLQLLPTDMEQVAELKSLQPQELYNRKPITYADQYAAGIMQVSSVLPESSAGKTIFKITLRPTQRSQSNGFAISVNYNNNYSVDKIAELRARRILLGEPLPKDLEVFFPTTQAEKEIFPELWVNLQTQPKLFLPKAWLKAVYSLKMNGIVEDVLKLELGPINNKVMPVRFRGRRRQVYANREPSIINFEGSCTLGE